MRTGIGVLNSFCFNFSDVKPTKCKLIYNGLVLKCINIIVHQFLFGLFAISWIQMNSNLTLAVLRNWDIFTGFRIRKFPSRIRISTHGRSSVMCLQILARIPSILEQACFISCYLNMIRKGILLSLTLIQNLVTSFYFGSSICKRSRHLYLPKEPKIRIHTMLLSKSVSI